jgi:WD40 repeat protein
MMESVNAVKTVQAEQTVETAETEKPVKAAEQVILTSTGHTGPMRFDGHNMMLLATIGKVTNDVHVWSAASEYQLVGVLKGHKSDVLCMAFTPDNTTLATSDYSRLIIVWNLLSMTRMKRLRHDSPCRWMCFSGCTPNLVSAHYHNNLRIWDIGSRQVVRIISSASMEFDMVPEGTPTCCTMSRIVVGTVTHPFLKVWDLNSGQKVDCLQFNTRITCMSVNSANEFEIAAGFDDGSVAIWDLQKNATLKSFRPVHEVIVSIRFDRGSNVFICSRFINSILALNLNTGYIRQVMDTPRRTLLMDLSPDGRHVAACQNRHIWIYDVDNGNLVVQLEEEVNHPYCYSFAQPQVILI